MWMLLSLLLDESVYDISREMVLRVMDVVLLSKRAIGAWTKKHSRYSRW